MKLQTKILLVLGLVIAACVIVLLVRDREPRYEDKPLTYWIFQLEYETEKSRAEARTTLRAMGDPAVKRLIRMLEQRDSQIKTAVNDLTRRSPIGHSIFRTQYWPHILAANALGDIGPSARAAIPVLNKASRDKDSILRDCAAAALFKIQEQPMVPLVSQLLDTRSTNWFRNAKMASHLGADGVPAILPLVKALQDDNYRVRVTAALCISRLHIEPEICVPALIVAVQDTNSRVRWMALSALCSFKYAAKSASGIVIGSLEDGDRDVRVTALSALLEVVPREEVKAAVPLVVQLLHDPDEMVRVLAADVLKEIDPDTAATQKVR